MDKTREPQKLPAIACPILYWSGTDLDNSVAAQRENASRQDHKLHYSFRQSADQQRQGLLYWEQPYSPHFSNLSSDRYIWRLRKL